MQGKPQNNLPEGLAQPALRALLASGITSLEKLATFSEAEIMHLHGIGPTAMGKLKAALLANGLFFQEKTAANDNPPRKGIS
jgi:DNA repair protein RadC